MVGVAKRKAIKIPSPEEIRKIRGKLTQEEAAEKVGVGQGVWSDWESGKRRPSRQSALLLDLLRRNKI